MKILHTLPREDGFYMPAEFAKHEGCFMIWPERGDSWRNGGWPARKVFVQLAGEIGKSEHMTVFVSDKQYETARAMLPDYVRVVECSTDDSWARDICPTFVINQEGKRRGIDWGFNAWGGLYNGLYFPYDKDNRTARKACDLYWTDCYDLRDFILEGGSIHTDGEGTLLTTETCLLSPGRNPDLSRTEIEEILKSTLSVEKILWLPCGIFEDETDEHVDNICAFTQPGRVVLAWTDNPEDPQYAMSHACETYLNSVTDAKGRALEIVKLPIPSAPICVTEEEWEGLDLMDGLPTRTVGERLAASYVNFYIANESVFVPQFGDKNDALAVEILTKEFPTRSIVPIYAREILLGGGNIHCMTQQIPLGKEC